MTFTKLLGCITLLFFTNVCLAQNSYNQQKEYGFNGKIKKVSTYMVYPSKYQIPTDTLAYFARNIMKFSRKGDLVSQEKSYDLPNYLFSQKMKFNGTGKNISYNEESTLNDFPTEHKQYVYKWLNTLSYEIMPTNSVDTSKRIVHLNNDFTIKQVIYKADNLQTKEDVTYFYNDEGQLKEVHYSMNVTKDNETTFTKDVQKIQALDVYNNPTVIYYFATEEGRVPKTVIFKYYEYY